MQRKSAPFPLEFVLGAFALILTPLGLVAIVEGVKVSSEPSLGALSGVIFALAGAVIALAGVLLGALALRMLLRARAGL